MLLQQPSSSSVSCRSGSAAVLPAAAAAAVAARLTADHLLAPLAEAARVTMTRQLDATIGA